MMDSVGLHIHVGNLISSLKCLGVKTNRGYPPPPQVDLYIHLTSPRSPSSEDQIINDVSKMMITSHICL